VGTSQKITPIKLSNWSAWFLALWLPQTPHMYKYTGCYWKVQTHLQKLWEEKGLVNLIELFVSRLMNHIYEYPVEREVGLIARVLSVCVKTKKYAKYIGARTQRSLCVTSRITMKWQAASSTALVNYSIIFPLKFTTINVFYKYIKKDAKKNFKCF